MPDTNVAAVILAGGKSSRMGRDKASIVIGGRSMLQWVIDAASEVAGTVVVVTARWQALPSMEARGRLVLVTDEREDAGPLAGMVTGLGVVEAPVALLLSCDQPFVQPALLTMLAAQAMEAAAAIPMVGRELQPLCSAVRRDARDTLRAMLERGVWAAGAIADLDGARQVERREWSRVDSEGLSFVGVNTPEELVRAEAIAARLDLGVG